jgi:hypothetical protein
LTQVNADTGLTHYSYPAANLKSEEIVGFECVKWVFIAAMIWFGLYQIALAIGLTPVF